MSIPTQEQFADPNFRLPPGRTLVLGIQHVLAMFVSNFTPAIIIGSAAGFAFGSADMIYLSFLRR